MDELWGSLQTLLTLNDIEVEILEDPWSDNPCIFNLNIHTNAYYKEEPLRN